MSTTFIPSRTDDAIAFIVDQAQAQADEKADAEQERYERAKSLVKLGDVLDELASTDETVHADFMEAMDRADRSALSEIFMHLAVARERAILHRLAEGD